MKGGVRKRGNTWSYYFDMCTVDGKRQKKEKGGFATKRKAEEALSVALTKYHNCGQVVELTKMSVSDYLDEWEKLYCVPNLKYNTRQSYTRIIRTHLKPSLGRYRLRTLNAASIQEYVNNLKALGFSRGTSKAIFHVLSGALDYAVEPLHYIDFNPCDRVKLPLYREPKTELHVYLDDKAMDKILDRFPEGSTFYVPIMIGYYTGVRISECFGLTWDKIDFDARTITIDHQIVRHDSSKKHNKPSWFFQSTKTYSSMRTIKFGQTLYDCLKEAKSQKAKSRIFYGSHYMEHYLQAERDETGDETQRIVSIERGIQTPLPMVDLVCVKDDGTMITTDSFRYASRVIHHELGLAFNYHSLRHTHATILIEAGADIKDVQERLGHSTAQTTIDSYVHNTDDMKDKTVELFELSASKKHKRTV